MFSGLVSFRNRLFRNKTDPGNRSGGLIIGGIAQDGCQNGQIDEDIQDFLVTGA